MKNILMTVGAAALMASAAHAEISDNVVKIGILNDMSGPYSALGGQGSLEAAKMAVEDFGGTVQGAPVEVVGADHQNKADIGATIARQWFDAEQVDTIMDLTTSSVALAVQAIAGEKQKIDIVTGGGTSDLSGKACTPYSFHWAYDTHALAVGTGGAVVKAGGDGTEAVAAKLKEMPVDDVFGRGAKVAANGRLMNTQYLMQVKTPDESRYDWDYYKIVAEIPGEQAYMDPAQSGCPLVQ